MKAKRKEFPYSAETLARALNGKAINQTEVRAPGPGHSAKDDSLRIVIEPTAPGGFLVHSFSGDDPLKCKDYVRERLGIASWQRGGSGRPGTDYIYYNADGSPYMKVTRVYKSDGKKTFHQYRFRDNDWAIGTLGLPRIPYRLNYLANSGKRPIYFVEGEKDADRLAAAGLVATTAPEGAAAQWRTELTAWFKERDVYILPDNDQPGRAHAHKIQSALTGVAKSIRTINLPNLPEKGDVSDWLDAGGDIAELISLCEAAPSVPANENNPTFNTDIGGTFRGLITESDVATRFVEIAADTLRYCHNTGAWFVWDGIVWRKNETKLVLDWAKRLAYVVSEGQKPKVAVTVRKASFARAVEALSQADQSLAVTIRHWDRDPYLLGTPGGTVNLRTGKLTPADKADGITKQVAVTPADDDNCPLWKQFLLETTGHDLELVRYLQQWAGYSLTGDTKEHALVFVYGGGGNGKSVFLNTVSGIIGQYGVVAAMDTFTASKDSKHPTDLAMLRGARMVTASETEEGRAWAEARIKQMTGGDEISARFMRQDFFTFKPQFKLTIVGNHKPVLQNVDDAARRRFNIIPFTRKPEKPDRELEQKLKAEWPAILRWMILGCQDWQENGLVRPASIVQATEEYFEEQDLFGRWLDECCDVDRQNLYKWESATELFASWKFFTETAGERPGTAKSLSATLLSRGFTKKRVTGGRTAYVGLRLK